MSAAVHIAVGDGPSGSRLVTATTRAAGFEVHVADAPDADDVSAALAAAIGVAPLVLVTTCVHGTVLERAPFVERVLDLAATDAERVCLTCEDPLTVGHESLRGRLTRRGVACPDAIVDGLGAPADVPAPDGGPPRADPELGGLTIVRHPGAVRLERALEGAPAVAFIDRSEYLPHLSRKRWMLDGLRLLAAVVAGGTRRYARAVATALELEHGLRIDPDPVLDRLHVLEASRDGAADGVPAPRRRDATPFVRAFDRCVGDPARVLDRHGSDVAPLVDAARSVAHALARPDLYADWSTLGPTDLSKDDDADAVIAFRNAVDGWFPGDEADSLAFDLRDAFEAHRRECACRPARR